MINAFLTGSRLYGPTNTESDVDIVIRCNPNLVEALKLVSDKWKELQENRGTWVRVSKLEIICCATDEQFNTWKTGTDRLLKEAPVTKQRSKEVFGSLFGNLQQKLVDDDVERVLRGGYWSHDS